MEKIDTYKTIVELNRIIETADLYLKKQLIFPIALIDDLGKIGDMGTEIEAYFKMSRDTNIIVEIEKIKRATLFQINSWCDIDPKTRLSITNCIRSLRDVVQNEQIETSRIDATTSMCVIPNNILEALFQAGFVGNIKVRPLKWDKSKSLLAYFVDVANDKLNLKHGEKRQIKPFEALFNVKGLTSAINDYKKTGDYPVGYKDIDKLFL